MKKKKILFIMESMALGGAERSLVTLLSVFDYSKYDVDLFLFHHNGELLHKIPKEVNILPASRNYETFLKDRKQSFITFLTQGKVKHSIAMSFYLLGVLYSKLRRKQLYIGWNYIQTLFEVIDKEYDVSISYLERKTMYFNVDKVRAKKKIGFIHNDYSRYPYDKKLDTHYFQFMNYIPTVSPHCKEVLVNLFPQYKEKFVVIPNMVLKEEVLELSQETITDFSLDNRKKIVSVGRLVKQKGFDIAISICKKLVDDGLDIAWYVVGEGEERKSLEKLIQENQLEHHFFLVGADKNPYKWMKIADVYVQPSRFEGFGITVAEAKVLQKPIVASKIPEFEMLLDNKYDCLASDNNQFIESIKNFLCNDENGDIAQTTVNMLDPLKQIYELIEE